MSNTAGGSGGHSMSGTVYYRKVNGHYFPITHAEHLEERIKELEAKCPPRVWIHTLDRRSVVPVHALVHFEAEHEHHEYLSTEEHTAIVKGLEAKLTEAQAERDALHISWSKASHEVDRLKAEVTIISRRERAEIERLREALQFISANRYGLQGMVEDGATDIDIAAYWSREVSILKATASEALAEGKDDGGRDERN